MAPLRVQVDPVHLAQLVSERLQRNFTSASILERGCFASVYRLIEASSTTMLPPVVVRVSTRPAYNDVARAEEKEKILAFVGVLELLSSRWKWEPLSFLMSLTNIFLP